MEGTILIVSNLPIDTTKIRRYLAEHKIGDFDVVKVETEAAAEEIFYGGGGVDCIVAQSEMTGTVALLKEMKQDEMFRHVPILLIIKGNETKLINEVYDSGFDAHIVYTDIHCLPQRIRPLIVMNVMYRNMMKQVGDLHEKAISDFILLDLIKNYIPKTIWDIAKTFAHEQKISIPEEELDLTIVFADIKGFTAMTQHMEPRQVVSILNTVFEVAAKHIYQNHGDIDKSTGDAFFAVFTKAKEAVTAMTAMQDELEQVNLQRKNQEHSPVEFRVGIHSGPIIRGNVGGHDRYDNTLIGDTVNTASRLEHIAPAGGIVISEETRTRIGITLPESCKSETELRGRDSKITVYNAFSFLRSKLLAPQDKS